MYTLQESARAQRSKMTIRVYENALPEDALYIRTVVFVEEQGFRDEFDEIDKNCLHLIAYDDDKPIAVCRCFYEHDATSWHIGRMAVLKEYRKKGIGSLVMTKAEEEIAKRGGFEAVLSSQYPVKSFYESLGYSAEGDIYLDEDYPHILMRKRLSV